jgi:hypothetical protein
VIVWALFGCVAPGDDSGAPLDTAPSDTDSAGDTDSAADTDTAGDTDSATDTDTAGDTDTAAPILAGALSVAGTWRGAPFVVTCTEADGDAVFVRYWSDAVGNVAGTVGCYRAEDPRPWAAVTFSSAATGEWSEPADATWMIGDTAGAWGFGSGGSTAWALAISRFERVDLDTYALTGTLSGAWAGDNGGGSVTGSFDALLPCSGACP